MTLLEIITRLDDYQCQFCGSLWQNGQHFRCLIVGCSDFRDLIVAALNNGAPTYLLAARLDVAQSTFYRAVTEAGFTFAGTWVAKSRSHL